MLSEVLRSSRFLNAKVSIIRRRFLALKANILLNHLIGDIARRGHEVPPSPYVAPPELLVQVPKFHHQLSRRFPLNVLHDLAGRHVRRSGHQNMDMIPRYMPLQNLDVVGPAHFPNQFPKPNCHLSDQHRFAVLGRPHEVVLDIKTRMCRSAVILRAYQCT